MITSSRFSPSSSPTWYRATLYRPPPTTLLQPFCNNDDQNLSGERQFRSKKISNSSVFDDMVAANRPLQATEFTEKGTPKDKGEHPAHIVVVIKSFAGGHSAVNIFNECEDSLIATALIIDSSILAEFITRVKHRNVDPPIASSFTWSCLCSPTVKPGNKAMLMAYLGLEGSSDLLIETHRW
ncbi:hypothetical protein FA15DRAFT_760586 [Coprinopsis marcescibilis]|uniref:inositol-3-phosphate synthase n=1 Tax=Coprinopsis marcescibilis TaxID=230819 RepID=A0A5C3KF18_COPMA|nr:hypothetical protein FA15DRAFT_760586 [Coprinopsis marcescibilis]